MWDSRIKHDETIYVWEETTPKGNEEAWFFEGEKWLAIITKEIDGMCYDRKIYVEKGNTETTLVKCVLSQSSVCILYERRNYNLVSMKKWMLWIWFLASNYCWYPGAHHKRKCWHYIYMFW